MKAASNPGKFEADVKCWRVSKENPSSHVTAVTRFISFQKKSHYPIFLCPLKTDLCPFAEEIDISGLFSSFS